MTKPVIRVTVTDLETGESQFRELAAGDYILIPTHPAHLAHTGQRRRHACAHRQGLPGDHRHTHPRRPEVTTDKQIPDLDAIRAEYDEHRAGHGHWAPEWRCCSGCTTADRVPSLLAELANTRAERDEARTAVLELGDAIIRANGWEPQNGVTVELSSALERLVVQRDQYRDELDKSSALLERARNEVNAYRRGELPHVVLEEVRRLDGERTAEADKLRAERDHLRKVLDAANATTEAAQRIVTAALADGTATITPAAAPRPASIRVVVVVDWERHRVHSITTDNEEARRHVRELAKGRKSWDAATMTAWVVDAPAAAPQPDEPTLCPKCSHRADLHSGPGKPRCWVAKCHCKLNRPDAIAAAIANGKAAGAGDGEQDTATTERPA